MIALSAPIRTFAAYAVQPTKRIYSFAILREIEITYRFRNIDCNLTGRKLESPDIVYTAFDFLKYQTKEQLIVVNLNNQNAVMNYEAIATGSVNGVYARVSEVLRTAIILNPPAIVLVHNHPSGFPTPSKSDVRFTQNIEEIANLLDITLLDHIIIDESSSVSLKQLNEI